METKKLTQELADRLKAKCGTYDKAARAIGITYRRWCQIRNRDETLNRRLIQSIEYVLNNRDQE